MTIKANCKINIGLDVLERREDGYHELSTVMIPICGLFDLLHFEVTSGSDVEFFGEGMVVDCSPESNLCVKAYNLMKKLHPDIGGLKITLDKRVPFGAGLGGGSSDATAVILVINRLFNLNCSEEQLIDLAAQLGSDTAFFVRNTPQLCSGRGEIMTSVDLNLKGKYIALIKPEINVSTGEAYSGVTPAYPATALSELIIEPVEQWQGKIKNDFEPHIFKAYPLLDEIKNHLLHSGAVYAAMSGSGSTIFGIFDCEQEAKDALRCFESKCFTCVSTL
ncbi:MAG: 4-(cytidine 5'-diphospho)-2-C-methyl-D-erythritol kinase [Rikenellaceae bacterium]